MKKMSMASHGFPNIKSHVSLLSLVFFSLQKCDNTLTCFGEKTADNMREMHYGRALAMGPVWFGLVWFGLVSFRFVWLGLVWFGLVRDCQN